MLLQRRKDLSHVKYEQESVDWTSYDGAEVFVDFMRFGEGSGRTPFFRVLLKWEDIEAILSALAEKKHDGAIRIQKGFALSRCGGRRFRRFKLTYYLVSSPVA
jgi:hypothetical protein